jgi:hypothetical protein
MICKATDYVFMAVMISFGVSVITLAVTLARSMWKGL